MPAAEATATMAANFDISDSTDWLSTPLPSLAPLDAALRCQVCKDFFSTPMITSCAHTFCSLCIRRCLAADGKCPTCRASDDASRLRRNWSVEESVETFANARGQVMDLAKEVAERKEREAKEKEQEKSSAGRRRNLKRKLEDTDLPEERESASGSQRQTRSQTKRAASATTSPEKAAFVVPDSEDEGQDGGAGDDEYQPDDGLVPCPICNRRMKEEAVFSHLDKCDGSGKDPTPSKPRAQPQPRLSAQKIFSKSSTPTPPPARLPQLNYSLLTENAMRKKLKDLGIPTWGPKSLLVRRHTEWINLYNSNCDAIRPRTKRELLHDLDSWERSQGGHAKETPATVMRKDFDGKSWAENNSDQFKDLIAAAKARRTAAKPNVEKSNETASGRHSEETKGATPTQLPRAHALEVDSSEATLKHESQTEAVAATQIESTSPMDVSYQAPEVVEAMDIAGNGTASQNGGSGSIAARKKMPRENGTAESTSSTTSQTEGYQTSQERSANIRAGEHKIPEHHKSSLLANDRVANIDPPQPPNEDVDPARPYANNEKGLSSIRAKVAAANEESHASQQEIPSAAQAEQAQNPYIPASQVMGAVIGARDQDSPQPIPEVSLSPPKKLPMFSLPEDPVTDTDTGTNT